MLGGEGRDKDHKIHSKRCTFTFPSYRPVIPKMSDIHNNSGPTNIPHEHDCPIAELVGQCRTMFSDLGTLLREDLNDNELRMYFDHETRFDTWCYSFKVSDQTFDLTLRNSPVLSKIIFQLLDQILSLLVTGMMSKRCS